MPSIRPTKFYRTPKYPTAEAVNANPLLLRRVPKRWLAKPAVCAALTFTVTSGLFSCASSDTSSETTTAAEVATAPSVPLFEHGDGRGTYGCVAVTSPLFLTEDEAAQVIIDEASRLGYEFTRGGTSVAAKLPNTVPSAFGADTEKLGTTDGPLDPDGTVADGLVFEFVSKDDLFAWETDDYDGPRASVSVYDVKDAATRLASNNTGVAAFYDPVAVLDDIYGEYDRILEEYAAKKGLKFDENKGYDLTDEDYEAINAEYDVLYEKHKATQIEQSYEDLRAQVRDFIAWLEGQGVI